MDCPTEEELAEYHAMLLGAPVVPAALSQPSPACTPQVNKDSHSFFQNDFQLSQIRPSNAGDTSNLVNRRLFGTPAAGSVALSQRLSSTPIGTEPAAGPSNPYQNFLDEELEYGNNRNVELNPRKRRLEDLFGDIDDIIEEQELGKVYYGFDTEDNARKKARCEEEIDLEMIGKILATRAANRTKAIDRSKRTKLEQLEALQKFKKQNLSESYPNWPSIPVLGDNRERIHVRMHSEEFETNQLKDVNFRRGFANLLGDNADRVWDEAQAIVQKRMLEPAACVQAASQQLNDLQIIAETSAPPPRIISDRLWVDKYRPQGYFDLLSDESTNRSLLTWLKMWDKMVFHREFKMSSKQNDAQKQTGSNFNKKTGRFEVGDVRYRKGRQGDLKTETDSYGRPIQKIAVLCGPPGLGKTTLAHTIARHAGYAVREINASDDRSPERFRLALQNGTEMQSTLLNQERRPNCIVLDEIDGAPTASIDFLLRFIADAPKEATKNPKQVGGKPAKSKNVGILRRPIICICNDIYTPSLRALRQVAFVVTFPPLDASRLAERLLAICRKERLRTDMTALLALADKSGNDVRSCISILQFYATTNKPLTLVDVLKSNIGQKDRQKGLFDIWSSIFHVQRSKQVLSTDNRANPNETVTDVAVVDSSLKSRVDTVLNVVQMGGDYERVLSGVHENYLNQRMPDANLHGLTVATEWFCFTDQLQTLIHSQQNYSVYPYLNYGFAVWHLLFAGLAWPKITFPTKGYEFYQKSTLQKSIRTALMKNISVLVRSLCNNPTIISDAIASIRQIICPSLRSVSLQLLTPKERSDLRHTVEVMADLGLSYSQLKSLDGTYQYQLEPDINQLCNFKVVTRANELTYSNMQIIAREVELEVMRRSAPRQGAADNPKTAQNRILQTSNKPNHLQRLVSKPIASAKVKETISKDFFGRITEKQVPLTVQEGGTDLIVKSPIWYRYKEGFNNAVRKDVTMKSLI